MRAPRSCYRNQTSNPRVLGVQFLCEVSGCLRPIGKRRPVQFPVNYQHLVFARDQVLDSRLLEVRLILPVPDELFTFPIVVVVMTGPPGNPDVAEDVVIGAMPMISA